MPTILPIEITETIIDILSQDEFSLPSIKTCALVSHVFLHLCRKHIWACFYVNGIYHTDPSSAKPSGITFVTTHKLHRLLLTTPEIAPYIRWLLYIPTKDDIKDPALVLQTFKKITCLKTLTIQYGLNCVQWNDNPLRPAMLHLMHLPTLSDISLYNIEKFMVEDLVPCTNLRRVEFDGLTAPDTDNALVSNLSNSSIRLSNISVDATHASIISKMCAMQRADQKLFFDFTYLNYASICIEDLDDIQASRTLFSRCKNLTNFDLDSELWHNTKMSFTRIGLSDILRPSIETLKYLHVGTSIYSQAGCDDFAAGFSFELEGMKNNNNIEDLNIEVNTAMEADWKQVDMWGRLDAALAQSGWAKLRKVSLTISISTDLRSRGDDELGRILKKLPQTQFPRLSSSRNVAFEFAVDILAD
ncbi:hypothetical protein BJ912DRAFT_443167 [Pholiota molesta]|nr:hypothetical protein BJ912DRAFT_443167 [Pholiota molesta]